MLYVGIDPSLSNTGICVLGPSGAILSVGQSNTLPTSPKRPAERLRLISDYVLGFIPPDGQVCIGYEDYSFDSVHRAFDLAELSGVLKMVLSGKYKSMHLFPPTVLKTFATGIGSAKKDLIMSQAAIEHPELDGQPNDVCDAYFLAMAAMYIDVPEKAIKVTDQLVRNRLTVINKKKYKELL